MEEKKTNGGINRAIFGDACNLLEDVQETLLFIVETARNSYTNPVPFIDTVRLLCDEKADEIGGVLERVQKELERTGKAPEPPAEGLHLVKGPAI